jgi:endoglucanase
MQIQVFTSVRRCQLSNVLINIGWNLGSTLEAIPEEGAWNNPQVDSKTFFDIKGAGFKSIRLPGLSVLNFTSHELTWCFSNMD